jgi:hypothetical protein
LENQNLNANIRVHVLATACVYLNDVRVLSDF